MRNATDAPRMAATIADILLRFPPTSDDPERAIGTGGPNGGPKSGGQPRTRAALPERLGAAMLTLSLTPP